MTETTSHEEVLLDSLAQFRGWVEGSTVENLVPFVRYLLTTDFFTCPASSRYHLRVAGGLFLHSHFVVEHLRFLRSNPNLPPPSMKFDESDTLSILGYFHDLCKVGIYRKDFRWSKDSGVWEKVDTWKKEDLVPLGHGEKSALILQNYIRLSLDELLAIRYHLGPWDPANSAWTNDFQLANNQCRLLGFMFNADTLTGLQEDGDSYFYRGSRVQVPSEYTFYLPPSYVRALLLMSESLDSMV